MGLTRDMFLKIKEEIANDPENVGYSGKTNAEIIELLNNHVIKTRVVEDAYPSPINRILAGMASGPNAITLTELSAALTTT